MWETKKSPIVIHDSGEKCIIYFNTLKLTKVISEMYFAPFEHLYIWYKVQRNVEVQSIPYHSPQLQLM